MIARREIVEFIAEITVTTIRQHLDENSHPSQNPRQQIPLSKECFSSLTVCSDITSANYHTGLPAFTEDFLVWGRRFAARWGGRQVHYRLTIPITLIFNFPSALGNPANSAGFPLSHNPGCGWLTNNRTLHMLQKADILTC